MLFTMIRSQAGGNVEHLRHYLPVLPGQTRPGTVRGTEGAVRGRYGSRGMSAASTRSELVADTHAVGNAYGGRYDWAVSPCCVSAACHTAGRVAR